MRSVFQAAVTRANYVLLELDLPGHDLTVIGVFLEDPGSNRLYIRLRRDWEQLAPEELDREVLEALEDDLERKASAEDLGADGLLKKLEDTLGNAIRMTEREAVDVQDFDLTLNRLYRKHVESNVLPFRTHLPLYTLRAAAGKFLENDQVSAEGWIEAPADLPISEEMFVAHIAGRSMEPWIPDGSLCVFRHQVTGSRQGKLVLVEDRQSTGTNRYAVKRYRSEKESTGEGWRHTRIRLESLNPEYESWDLDPDEEKYAILGEFVRVLE
jgi:SOS-response transcriptional repressor LexA